MLILRLWGVRPLGFIPAAASHSEKINCNSFGVTFEISSGRAPEYRSSSVWMLREIPELITELRSALSSVVVKMSFEACLIFLVLLGSRFVICLFL